MVTNKRMVSKQAVIDISGGFIAWFLFGFFSKHFFFSKLSLLTKRKNYELYCILNMNLDFSIILFLQSLDHIIKYSTHTFIHEQVHLHV